MKKIFCFSFFIFSFLLAKGQIWNWAKAEPYGSDPYPFYLDHVIASDNSGNIYYTNTLYTPPNIVKYDQNSMVKWNIQPRYCYDCSSTAVSTYSGMEYLGGVYSYPYMIFGTDTIRATSLNVFIAEFDSAGIFKWAGHTTNKSIIPRVETVANDGTGNVYAAGWFFGLNGTLKLGSDSVKGSSNKLPFIMKFDRNGHPKWMRTGKPITDSDLGVVQSLTVDDVGNAYITGAYRGTLIFGQDTLPYDINRHITRYFNAYLVKYDSAGNIDWTWNATVNSGKGSSTGVGLGVDHSGNVYLDGSFTLGTLSIGSQTFGPVNKLTPYFSKFNSTGSLSWAHEVMKLDSNAWGAVSLATDTLNNSYMLIDCSSGDYSYKLGIGADTFRLNSNFFTTDVLVEFDTSGKVKCGTIFSEGNENDGDDINVSRSGQYLYLAGDVAGKCGFGPDTINGNDVFFIASWQPCNTSFETGIKQTADNTGLKVFPNPTKGIFTITLGHAELASAFQPIVEIYNVMGQKVLTATLRSTQADNLINLSKNSSGVYFYRVLSQDGSLVGEGKVIVEK